MPTIAQKVGNVSNCGAVLELKRHGGGSTRVKCSKAQGHHSDHYDQRLGRSWPRDAPIVDEGPQEAE